MYMCVYICVCVCEREREIHFAIYLMAHGSVDKESAWNAGDKGDAGLIPRLELSPEREYHSSIPS